MLPLTCRTHVKLTNIRILGFQNREAVREILNLSEAVFVSFQDIPVLQTSSPNKFFDGLAAGKMVIVNFDGWIRQLVEDHNCGFYWQGTDAHGLAKRIKEYTGSSDLLRQAQKNARVLGETQFSREIAIRKFLEAIEPSGSRSPGVLRFIAG